MSTKVIVLTVLIVLFIILVAIDGRRKLKNKKQQDKR